MDFTLISDIKVTSIPIAESGEPLVDLRDQPEMTVATKRSAENPLYYLLRSGARDRLLLAARQLPPGVGLCLEEAYRSFEQQQFLFDRYVDDLRTELGIDDEDRLAEEATKYVARPQGVPPHSTGGAVDVTLVTREGEELDMGSVSDDTPLMNGDLNYMHSPSVTERARKNRTMLADAMTQAGFVNYPAEWWHWSYGDQYWAYLQDLARAIYSSASADGGPRARS